MSSTDGYIRSLDITTSDKKKLETTRILLNITYISKQSACHTLVQQLAVISKIKSLHYIGLSDGEEGQEHDHKHCIAGIGCRDPNVPRDPCCPGLPYSALSKCRLVWISVRLQELVSRYSPPPFVFFQIQVMLWFAYGHAQETCSPKQ